MSTVKIYLQFQRATSGQSKDIKKKKKNHWDATLHHQREAESHSTSYKWTILIFSSNEFNKCRTETSRWSYKKKTQKKNQKKYQSKCGPAEGQKKGEEKKRGLMKWTEYDNINNFASLLKLKAEHIVDDIWKTICRLICKKKAENWLSPLSRLLVKTFPCKDGIQYWHCFQVRIQDDKECAGAKAGLSLIAIDITQWFLFLLIENIYFFDPSCQHCTWYFGNNGSLIKWLEVVR